MSILSKYLFKEFGRLGGLFLLGNIVLLLSILTINRVFQKDAPMTIALQYTGYQMPELIVNSLPILCLLTGIALLSTLARKNELIVLFSSGISTKSLLYVFLKVGLTVSLSSFVLINWILPPIIEKKVQFRKTFIENKPDTLSGIEKNRLWYKSSNSAYSFQGFNINKKILFNFSAYDLTENFKLKRNIEAKKAYDREDELWHLEDVIITSFTEKSKLPVIEKYNKKTLLIKNYPVEFEDINLGISTLNLNKLWNFILRNKKIGVNTVEYEILFWRKINLILLPIITIALAFLLKIRNFQKQSLFRDIIICFSVTILYFLVDSLGKSVTKLDFIPTFMIAFIPGFLLLSTGASFLLLEKRIK